MDPWHGGLETWPIDKEGDVGVLQDMEGFMVVNVAEPILYVCSERTTDWDTGDGDGAGL